MAVNLEFKQIKVGKGRRPVIEKKLEALMLSIRAIGLLHPISVVRDGDVPHQFRLVAGLHRLEAMRRIGHFYAIPAEIIDVNERLIEIDENMVRAELTRAQRSALRLEQKRLYEAKFPHTKRGKNPGGGKGHGKKKDMEKRQNDVSPKGFVQHAAEATGQSKSTIEREVRLGAALERHGLEEVAGTVLDKPGTLKALTELAEASPDAARALLDRAKAGESGLEAELKRQAKAKPKAKAKPRPADKTEPETMRPLREIRDALAELKGMIKAEELEAYAQELHRMIDQWKTT
jgi:ParB-like chromosome segregation protein Spo0J